MKPSELQKENDKLKEQVAGLLKRIAELEAARPKSKTREQAERGLEMLQKGPVSLAQFATINPKYPSDVAYAIRNTLKVDVKTVRTSAGSLYMLPEHFERYQEAQKKDKEPQPKDESKPPAAVAPQAMAATAQAAQ